jgi:hypothetical protein
MQLPRNLPIAHPSVGGHQDLALPLRQDTGPIGDFAQLWG